MIHFGFKINLQKKQKRSREEVFEANSDDQKRTKCCSNIGKRTTQTNKICQKEGSACI
jgi:hypothetical protein